MYRTTTSVTIIVIAIVSACVNTLFKAIILGCWAALVWAPFACARRLADGPFEASKERIPAGIWEPAEKPFARGHERLLRAIIEGLLDQQAGLQLVGT